MQGPGGGGCLLEQTWGGSRTVSLEGGGTRLYLEDGDTVTLSGYCQGEGFKVGFGECKGKVLPATDS
jgi:fumarylacetoacetase